MQGMAVVLCHMFVWRIVAAQGNAAGLAGAQVYPGAALFHALFAHTCVPNVDRCQDIDMLTNLLIAHDEYG
jgi:hypothetical protein